jgi:hypothetical protein
VGTSQSTNPNQTDATNNQQFKKVHRAVLKDGTDVVVKVQHPGAFQTCHFDMGSCGVL